MARRKSSVAGRETVPLNPALDKTLSSYALAAGAAGIGLLALSPQANAEVVFTRAHQTILPNTTLTIDLNNDSIGDFNIINFDSHQGGYNHHSFGYVKALGLQYSNRLIHTSNFIGALPAGYRVSYDAFANGGVSQMFFCQTSRFGGSQVGHWANQTNRFLGFQFSIAGQTHYGWARLSSRQVEPRVCRSTLVLTGYAYENVTNKPIVTGKTSLTDDVSSLDRLPAEENGTLGALAQGAPRTSAGQR